MAILETLPEFWGWLKYKTDNMATETSAIAAAREDWTSPQDQFLRITLLRELRGIALKKNLPVNIPALIAKYIIDPKLTNWHTALKRLNLFPERIPRLPENIRQILYSECSIYRRRRKEDGTPYRVIDTHLLYLIPAGTLNEFEARVQAYGAEHLSEYGEENPLRIEYFWGREQHGNTRFDEPKWVLLTEKIIPGSRYKSDEAQQRIIERFQRQVPSLRAVVGVAFLHKIATGQSILQAGNEKNEYRYTCTRVREVFRGYYLVVGGFAPSGLDIDPSFRHGGIAGLAEIEDY